MQQNYLHSLEMLKRNQEVGPGWMVSTKNGARASMRESRGKTIDYRIYKTVNVQLCIHLCFFFSSDNNLEIFLHDESCLHSSVCRRL